MQTLAKGYTGLRFLVNMNLDRVLSTATVIGALYFSAYVFLA